MMKRRSSRQIKIGGLKVGGGSKISIQSMAKIETKRVSAVVAQIKGLEKAGCEIVRVAIKDPVDADAVRSIRKKIRIPLVCDIHFDYRLALQCIAAGADKIRLNPGNIYKRDEVAQVIRAARKAKIPIRIGVNSGSVFARDTLVSSALRYIKLFEEEDFHDIIISLKASGVRETVDAYRQVARMCEYPLHLGVTASGPYETGIIKSAIGIGSLLLDGIGDTIRVSITGDPRDEVMAAKRILGSLGIRDFGPEIISCPTCGRCQVDLGAIVESLERKLSALGLGLSAKDRRMKVAVMGCEVNGPGEAREADIGIAFGKGSGILFRKGKIVCKVSVEDAVSRLAREISGNR
jgi:(E)-4-hydroxy-3-methylbut-2-enyl-diphosphate synthase